MYTSATFLFTAIMALIRVAMATPPACLLAAIAAQSNPADLKSLCGALEPQVAGNITQVCHGDSEAAAISAYSATCLSAQGVTISIATTSSGSSTASATGSHSAKTTGSATATATGSQSSGTATATGSPSTASSTGKPKSNAGSNSSPQSGLFMGAILLGLGLATQLVL